MTRQIPQHKPWYRQDRYSQYMPQAVLAALQSSSTEREVELLRACIMAFAYERDRYTGIDLTGMPGGYNSLAGALHYNDSHIMSNRSTPWINKIKSVIDVVTDKILQGLPSLSVRSSDARFEDLRMHDIRSAALNTVMSDQDAHRELYMWTRDGLIKRIGWIRSKFEHGRLQLERLHPWQVHYSLQDSLEGKLSQVHTVHLVDREEWLDWYKQLVSLTESGKGTKAIPGHKGRIDDIAQLSPVQTWLPSVTGFNQAWLGAYRWLLRDVSMVTDQIRVVWSYKRAWRAGETSGRVVCTIMGDSPAQAVVALDMPFTRSTLPVVHWAPWRADVGVTGISMAEQLIGAQMVTDQTLLKMSRLQQKYGHPKLPVRDQSMTDESIKALLSAGVEIVRFKDVEDLPGLIPGLALNASDLSWLNLVLDRPASEQGVTPALTEGRSALGPNASGVARLEERFQSLDRQQGVRDAHTWGYRNLGVELINCIDDALHIDKGIKARWPGKVAGQFRERPWAELQLSNGDFWLDVDEKGELGNTRAGRVQRGLELYSQGFLTFDSVREMLFSNADIDRAGAREIAPRRAIQAQLQIILDPKSTDDEIAEAQPTEDMDLEDAAFLTTAIINQAIAHQAKPETLMRLRGYLAAISATRAQSQPATPAPLPAAAAPGTLPPV